MAILKDLYGLTGSSDLKNLIVLISFVTGTVGVLLGMFGYRIFKFLISFSTGVVVSLLLTLVLNLNAQWASTGVMYIIALVGFIFGFWMGFRFYQFALFCSGFILFAILTGLITEDGVSALVIGIIAGVLTVALDKLALIILSSLSGSVLLTNAIGYVVSVPDGVTFLMSAVFVFFFVYYQYASCYKDSSLPLEKEDSKHEDSLDRGILTNQNNPQFVIDLSFLRNLKDKALKILYPSYTINDNTSNISIADLKNGLLALLSTFKVGRFVLKHATPIFYLILTFHLYNKSSAYYYNSSYFNFWFLVFAVFLFLKNDILNLRVGLTLYTLGFIFFTLSVTGRTGLFAFLFLNLEVLLPFGLLLYLTVFKNIKIKFVREDSSATNDKE